MHIAVVGTGYVGLVTGTCFAETGNQVICVDIDAKKVERMKNGEVPIYEPGLEQLFRASVMVLARTVISCAPSFSVAMNTSGPAPQ